MGGRVATCPLDLSNYSLQIHWGDAFFHDLWGRCCHSSGDRIPYIENEFFQSKQQQWAIREEFRLNRRTKGECHGLVGLLTTQAQVVVRCQRKVKATDSSRLGLKKGVTRYKEPNIGKIETQLRRAISYYIDGRNRGILS